jgi:hypothetical protein
MIDFTNEVHVCHRCAAKQEEQSASDRKLWRNVQSSKTREFVSICGGCVGHYATKSHSECSISVGHFILNPMLS